MINEELLDKELEKLYNSLEINKQVITEEEMDKLLFVYSFSEEIINNFQNKEKTIDL